MLHIPLPPPKRNKIQVLLYFCACQRFGSDIIFFGWVAIIPAEILRCKAISRELNFSSQEMMQNFHLEQRVFLHSTCIEGVFNRSLKFDYFLKNFLQLFFSSSILLDRVEVFFWICHSKFYKYLAVNN